MSRPSLRTFCSSAARRVSAAACLLVMAPNAATATAPLAGPLPTGFCGSTLTPLAEFVQALGYSISFDGSGFSATSGASDLRCICIEGQVVIEIAERDAIVPVTRERFELEIARGRAP